MVFILVLISACGASNDEGADAENFKYNGNWGRAFLLFDDKGQAICIKEIVSLTEVTWKIYQFLYLDENCDSFSIRVEFSGTLEKVTGEVVDGLPVERLLIENIDWTWMASIGLFLSEDSIEFYELFFAIIKGMQWEEFKVETFEFDLFEDDEILFSNTFTAYILYFFPSLSVNGRLINLESNYIEIESVTKESVDKIELR